MNRLCNLGCYLSGAVDNMSDKGAAWRDSITPFLEAKGVKVFNPLKHVFYGTQELDTVKRPRMKKLLQDGNFEALYTEMKQLNHWDLRAVDISSFLVVNYDITVFTCGTHEEIFKANTQIKPVLLMIGAGNRGKMPQWMYGRFPPSHMFESWDELKLYLTAIDSDPNYRFKKEDLKRWLFFDGPNMA